MNTAFFMDKLKAEGFKHVFERRDVANAEFPPHTHEGRVSFYIAEGSVTIGVKDKPGILFTKGERHDMVPNVSHWVKIGPAGCLWVVGEDVQGDV